MSPLKRRFPSAAILATVGFAVIVSGCTRSAAYDFVQTRTYKLTEAQEATPEKVLGELLGLTDINLDAAQRDTMLAHLSEKSPQRRRMILSHLKTANGRSVSPGMLITEYVYEDWQAISYPVPDGVTKVQFLQQLMTTSTAGATPGN